MRVLPSLFLAVIIGVLAIQPSGAHALDTEFPIIETFSISNEGVIAPGDTVSLDYHILEPGGSGLVEVFFNFISPVGDEIQFDARFEAAPDGPATWEVPPFAAAGVYTLDYARVEDADGNAALYFSGGQITGIPGGAVGPTSHSFNFSEVTFTVTNAAEDIVAPTLSAFSLVSAGPFEVGDMVTINFTASDGAGSGIYDLVFEFEDVIGGTQRVLNMNPPSNGIASSEVQVTWAPGTYTLRSIKVSDEAENDTIYQADGEVLLVPEGLSGPTGPHSFNFATSVFTVDNPAGDIATPVLASFSLPNGLTYLPGMELAVDYVASDPGSGLSIVHFDYQDEGLQLYQAIVYGQNVATGPATAMVEANWPGGVLQLASVTLYDQNQLSVTYRRDGTVVADPPGALTAGGTHSFNFEDFDITIVASAADASCDGSVGIDDVLLIRMIEANLADPVGFCTGDADGDESVTSADALRTLRVVAGLDPDPPVVPLSGN